MTEKLKQKTKEELSKMPNEIQEAINSFDWGQISEEIGKKYLLEESEINDLQVEIMLVMIGMTSVDNLKTNIENNVGTSKDEAEKIGNELFEKIFGPIGSKIAENIKKNLKENTITWKQNINFVLSGGDYTVFLQRENITDKMVDKPVPEKTPVNYSKIEDLKNKFTI